MVYDYVNFGTNFPSRSLISPNVYALKDIGNKRLVCLIQNNS
jgi:hypothetical protein